MTQLSLDLPSLIALASALFTLMGTGLFTILGWFSNRLISRVDERFDRSDAKLEHLDKTVFRETAIVERLQQDVAELNLRVSRLESRD